MSFESYCESIYAKALAAGCAQPVPGDFLIKKTAMALFAEMADIPRAGRVLEVGSGSGFNAALLAGMADHVVATDLPYYDSRTHSLGIAVAGKLCAALGVPNVSVVSCGGETLPFSDGAFDLVYSSSVLEHIDDKEAALREMLRVTKPGGTVVCIIPTCVQSLAAFLHLYLYMVRRIVEVAAVKVFRLRPPRREGLLPRQDDVARTGSAIAGSFSKSHPSFPFPEPHGAYRNIAHEFAGQLPWRWLSLAKRCGARSLDTFATLFLPFNIFEVFSTRSLAALYAATRKAHAMLARSPLQYFCYAWCLMLRK